VPGRDKPRHHGRTHATHADEGNLFAHESPPIQPRSFSV
jgi:hypothetical protein